jgi:SpoVK/Ycf46/Vps4 family AAA+-type ATPase
MARSDLLIGLVKTGVKGNMRAFKRTVEAIISEERAKNHNILADQLSNILQQKLPSTEFTSTLHKSELKDSVYGIMPQKKLSELVVSTKARSQVEDLVEEYLRRDLLRSYNLEPKHKVLLYGPPGNGKTSMAEAIAEKLSLPFYILKYEDMIESFLGNTAKKMDQVFDYIKNQRCVFFLDEFESIAKDRGDEIDSGEMKRIVSSLLLQIDNLPSHVILVAATNHTKLVDKAFWRRFQLHINLPNPTKTMTKKWFDLNETIYERSLGVSSGELSEKLKGFNFSELEEFALDVMRKYVLCLPDDNIKKITLNKIKHWNSRLK